MLEPVTPFALPLELITVAPANNAISPFDIHAPDQNTEVGHEVFFRFRWDGATKNKIIPHLGRCFNLHPTTTRQLDVATAIGSVDSYVIQRPIAQRAQCDILADDP